MYPLFLVVAAVLQPGVPAPALHYRLELTGTRQYQREHIGTDSASVGGDFTITAFIATTVRDSAGGRIGRLLIDSVRCSGTGLLSMAYDSSVGQASRGVWLDVALDQTDETAPAAPSTRNPVTSTIAQYARAFFVPAHARLSAGGTWADTIDVHISAQNYSESGPTITRWKVVSVGPDATDLEATIVRMVAVSGRVSASGMVLGTGTVSLNRSGAVRRASVKTSQQLLLANDGATEARTGQGSTTATIDLLP